ncbi:glycosyltransferase family 2 protein [Nitrosococcus wardiae]|uniref:Glycosyltransferase family 2 protein n=1 Tax=Nitrosococcus wardiae TaxID=1814290 RepID=A0A4P7C144_9GAMM|nr:glycosyltransferase family 2 protein [Nitrosococcus wardiae]QBQ54496.1 glycosyltransferase family 2 protein [Nitrosococcus wardiae]
MALDIAIQIVNYKTKKYLIKSLKDVFDDLSNCTFTYKINILDNCSGDDLSDLELEFKENKNIAFYYSNKNLGFGAGHNLLAKKSSSKYILLLNPDIEFIEEDTIKRLMEKAEKSDDIKVVGPKLIGKDGKVQVYDHGELHGFTAWVINNAGNAYWKDRSVEGEVAWVSGAVFLIKRSAFEKVGGFDENYFLYKEEEDLCLGIRKLGGKIMYVPDIKLEHYNSVVAKKANFMPASKIYYVKKHYKNPVKRYLLERLQRILYPD